MSQFSGWIWTDNLLPCLALLASVGETELDEGTRDAFEGGLKDTDFDSDRWYDLPLGRLTVGLAREESGKVHTRIEAPHGFGRAVEAVVLACSTYRLEAP